MKFALIGQDIPSLLPALLTDLFFAGKADAEVWVEERNPAMQGILAEYGRQVSGHAGLGRVTVTRERMDVLEGADCVLYAGDYMASSRFRQDREALSGVEDGDAGLTDQARVDGGLGGLMHTLRQGEKVYELIDAMDENCPDALAVTLGRPVARTAQMFLSRGYTAYGLGAGWLKGPSGLEALAAKLGVKPGELRMTAAGLPGFAWLLSAQRQDGTDLLPTLEAWAADGSLGRLTRRWLESYGAVPVGDVTAHAEFLPAQEDYAPAEDPALGESVERRKDRIRWMNTVAEKGIDSQEGRMAQLLLLSRAPAQRPVRLALAVLRAEDLDMEAVTRRNAGEIRGLPAGAVVESRLTLRGGVPEPHGLTLPGALTEVCLDIDEANRLAARAASGDRTALRECIEADPALGGLDRLYLQDAADRLIAMHSDILTRFE